MIQYYGSRIKWFLFSMGTHTNQKPFYSAPVIYSYTLSYCTIQHYNTQNTMYKIQCTKKMYKIQCTKYKIQCTKYNIQCTKKHMCKCISRRSKERNYIMLNKHLSCSAMQLIGTTGTLEVPTVSLQQIHIAIKYITISYKYLSFLSRIRTVLKH